MKIEPIKKLGGSAFQNNYLNATRPIPHLHNQQVTNVVSLSDWCKGNFVSKRIGRNLIKRKLLIAFRRHHIWWVCANSDCLDELLAYLGMEQLLFDADNE